MVWSFFTKAAKPSAAGPRASEPDATGADDGERGFTRPGGPGTGTGPAGGAGAGEVREPGEPSAATGGAGQAAPADAAVAGPGTHDERSAGNASGMSGNARGMSGNARGTSGSAPNGGPAARDPATEVTVVPGITRYHRSECILIRFLGPEDLQTMTLQAAEAASYVPCKACRPEQELADG